MVKHPADYAWSSYRSNAMGKTCAMLEPHEVNLSLGATPSMRQLAYREFSCRRWIRYWSMMCGPQFRPVPRWVTTVQNKSNKP